MSRANQIIQKLTFHYRYASLQRPVTWVALIGFMGAGKSRIGLELSRRLSLNFVDTDKIIERVAAMSIPNIFKLYGETTFRSYETEIIRRCTRLDEAVISTGGGAVVKEINRKMLKARGPVVLLTASPETTYKRTCNKRNRPLLDVDNPIKRIGELIAERQKYYQDAASFTVSTDERKSYEVVEEVVDKLRQWKQEFDNSNQVTNE